jgi:hypothetical protein
VLGFESRSARSSAVKTIEQLCLEYLQQDSKLETLEPTEVVDLIFNHPAFSPTELIVLLKKIHSQGKYNRYTDCFWELYEPCIERVSTLELPLSTHLRLYSSVMQNLPNEEWEFPFNLWWRNENATIKTLFLKIQLEEQLNCLQQEIDLLLTTETIAAGESRKLEVGEDTKYEIGRLFKWLHVADKDLVDLIKVSTYDEEACDWPLLPRDWPILVRVIRKMSL